MKFLLALFAVAAVAAVLLALMRRGRPSSAAPAAWPLYAKKVLSAPEQVLYQRLIRAFPHHVILAQVALPAIVGVSKGEDWRTWSNRFNRLYADFVVCEPDFRVTAVLELDDRSHDNPKRQDADARKAAALAAAGIPLHRVNVNPLPNEADLQQLFGVPARLTHS